MDEMNAAVVSAKLDALTELCRTNFKQLEDRLDRFEQQTTERLTEHTKRLHDLEQFKAREEGRQQAEKEEETHRDWSKLVSALAAFAAGAGGGILGSGNLPH